MRPLELTLKENHQVAVKLILISLPLLAVLACLGCLTQGFTLTNRLCCLAFILASEIMGLVDLTKKFNWQCQRHQFDAEQIIFPCFCCLLLAGIITLLTAPLCLLWPKIALPIFAGAVILPIILPLAIALYRSWDAGTREFGEIVRQLPADQQWQVYQRDTIGIV